MSNKAESSGTEEVEATINRANDVLQESAIGQKLPKKVKNLGTEDLLKFAAIFKLLYFFPLFTACTLVANARGHNKVMQFFSKFATWVCYIQFVDFFNYIIYILDMADFFAVCYLFTIIKSGVTSIYILAMFFSLGGFTAKFSITCMFLSSIYVDIVFLLYLDQHFRELKGERDPTSEI